MNVLANTPYDVNNASVAMPAGMSHHKIVSTTDNRDIVDLSSFIKTIGAKKRRA